jgi:hypothetical protein
MERCLNAICWNMRCARIETEHPPRSVRLARDSHVSLFTVNFHLLLVIPSSPDHLPPHCHLHDRPQHKTGTTTYSRPHSSLAMSRLARRPVASTTAPSVLSNPCLGRYKHRSKPHSYPLFFSPFLLLIFSDYPFPDAIVALSF